MHNDNALHAALHWSRRRFLRVVGTSVVAVPLFSACSGAPTTPTPGPEAAQSPPSPRWPLTLNTAAGTMLLYEPQLDTWNGHALTTRLAVAVQGTGQERTFGVIWISAQSTVDKDTRLVTLNHPHNHAGQLPLGSGQSRSLQTGPARAAPAHGAHR